MCYKINLLYKNCRTIRTKPHKISKFFYCNEKYMLTKTLCKNFFDAGGISSRMNGNCPICKENEEKENNKN